MIHLIADLLLSAICPWLLVLLGLQALTHRVGPKRHGWPRLAFLGILAAGLLIIPVRGTPIALWVRSLSANFSIPFIGLLAVAVWEGEFGRKLFSRADWTAAWAFGAIGGIGLYPLALGWGSFDTYEWGWRFSPLLAAVGTLSALLLWKQNRFGLLLLLAAAAWHLHLLETANYWDYLLDPVYCLLSFVALGLQLVVRAKPARPAMP